MNLTLSFIFSHSLSFFFSNLPSFVFLICLSYLFLLSFLFVGVNSPAGTLAIRPLVYFPAIIIFFYLALADHFMFYLLSLYVHRRSIPNLEEWLARNGWSSSGINFISTDLFCLLLCVKNIKISNSLVLGSHTTFHWPLLTEILLGYISSSHYISIPLFLWDSITDREIQER